MTIRDEHLRLSVYINGVRAENQAQALELFKEKVMTNMTETLKKRGERYGDFTEMSIRIRQLQKAMYSTRGYTHLPSNQQHALDMIMVKIGRILVGDAFYADNWRDIEGYARLVAESLSDPDQPEKKHE